MSDSIFDKEGVDEIIKKMKNDKSGRLTKTMRELMDICEKAGKYGFSLKDVSIIGTTGWYLSQNPQLRQFFDQLMSMPPPDDDIYN